MFEESPRAADQAAREKRIGFGRSQQDAENAVLPDENRADHGERKLEPGSKSWFVSKARTRSAAPARLLSARTGRSKKIPPTKNAAMIAARKLET